MFGDVSSSEINTHASIVNSETFEHRSGVTNSVSTVKHQTCSLTSGVQTEDSLLLEEELWCSELFKEQICRFYSVLDRVEWCLSQQDRVFLR